MSPELTADRIFFGHKVDGCFLADVFADSAELSCGIILSAADGADSAAELFAAFFKFLFIAVLVISESHYFRAEHFAICRCFDQVKDIGIKLLHFVEIGGEESSYILISFACVGGQEVAFIFAPFAEVFNTFAYAADKLIHCIDSGSDLFAQFICFAAVEDLFNCLGSAACSGEPFTVVFFFGYALPLFFIEELQYRLFRHNQSFRLSGDIHSLPVVDRRIRAHWIDKSAESYVMLLMRILPGIEETQIGIVLIGAGGIESAAVKEGEEEELSQRYKRLSNAREVLEHLSLAARRLRDIGCGEAMDDIRAAARYDEGLSSIYDELSDADSIIGSVLSEIDDYVEETELDSRSLSETEERLELIRRLFQKYGDGADKVQSYLEKRRERLRLLSDYEQNREKARTRTESPITMPRASTTRRLFFSRLVMSLMAQSLSAFLQDEGLHGTFMRGHNPCGHGQLITFRCPGSIDDGSP